MKYYHLSAELLAPLLVQENRQSNMPRGLQYLPGSSLRGALAAKFLRYGGGPDDEAFKTVFLESPVCFPDLLPTTHAKCLSHPIPATANSCKHAPGFLGETAHGVQDSLAALAAGEMARHTIAKSFMCATCGYELKPYTGFWNGDSAAPEASTPVLTYQRHTGIDRHTGTVAPAIFYTTQGIAEIYKSADGHDKAQHLSGGLFLTENQSDALSGMLTDTVFAGADRTRGMGELKISLTPGEAHTFDLEQWDRFFRKKIARLTEIMPPSGLFFSIGFAGHAIIVDRFLRPSTGLALDFEGIVPVLSVISGYTVRGWQSSWGLPKPEDIAIRMGGVSLYRYTGDGPKGLTAFLNQLTISGIGLRRAEGFGRIRISEPLHTKEVI